MAMRNREDDGMITKVVSINRVSKTVKGGRIMKFAALVVVGDGKGTIGYGIGKSGEVPEAIRKGEAAAKKNMHKVAMKGTTIPHEIVGKYGTCSTRQRPFPFCIISIGVCEILTFLVCNTTDQIIYVFGSTFAVGLAC